MPVPDATLSALRWVRDDYRDLVASATQSGLRAGTAGTRWTNRELLFHMWFGQRIARVFIPLLGLFGRLPRPASAAYSRLLTALTRPYGWVNYIAPVGGARLLDPARVQRWMDKDSDWLLAWASRASEDQLNRGMVVPVTWDPYFSAWMTRAD
ncbi:MAG TPA: DinB family protein, partial [Propionibacteriaceae bacterium]|nr:DinB family protein [Propionibacteriaceae bacterium]